MNRRSYLISLILMIASGVLLYDSPALFAPYLLAILFAAFCLRQNHEASFDKKRRAYRIVTVVSVLSAVMITLANYRIWMYPELPDVRTSLFVRALKLFNIAVIFAGSFVSCHNIFRYVCFNKDAFALRFSDKRERALKFFIIPFVIIFSIYLAIYLCCYYPGLLSLDSIDQITQLFTGKYTNHQPFYHTQLIGLFLRAGLSAWGDMNTAVATYVVFQMLFMAATFAYTVYNVALLKMPKWVIALSTIWYAVMPFHIMFSFTVWKDVLFGAFTTLMIIYFIRMMKGIGNRYISLTGFALSGLVICLIRSNGLFAYVFVFLAVLILARKDKDIIFAMLTVIIASFILKHAVLGSLNVTQPDTVETLSIPLQQVARVIKDDGNISTEDTALLSKIIDVSAIKENYDPGLSDPIKNMIRDFGNEDYLTGNMGAYGGLYLRTLVKNPMTYVIAWVDSTVGYWNSGYNYWVWFWDIESNQYGIFRNVANENVLHAMDEYLWLFYNNRVFQIFIATGFFVWIAILCFARCISSSNKTGIIALMPIAAILLSLVISSPVFAEFRYMYALFCALPILLSITCHDKEAKE